MFSKPSLSITSLILVVVSNMLFNTPPGVTRTHAQSITIARLFSLPLGYSDGVSYGPRINYLNGILIEDSEYGVLNPDMQGNTCFGVDWGQIYHAGEDWYRHDGQSTWQADVTVVADGVVKYIGFNFPGAVIIIEHSLPPDGQQKIYSLYGHLDPNSVLVSVNQNVSRGQKLGTVMQQFFDGRYTDYHDDSHLHFEMRYFYDASNIYINYPNCNGYLPGRGYTYPEHPDNFPPAQSERYTDPISFVQNRAGVFLPLVLKQEPICVPGRQLIGNRGFESGSVSWVEIEQPGYSIITNILPAPATAYSGSWVAWFGGRNNATERIYQEFLVSSGMIGANLSFYSWMGTDEPTSGAYDKLYVRLRDSNDNIIQQLGYLDNNSLEHTWLYHSASLPDLSLRIGQILRLSFDGTTDGSFITSFLVDEVSLTAVCYGVNFLQLSEPPVIPTYQSQTVTGGLESTKPPVTESTQSSSP